MSIVSLKHIDKKYYDKVIFEDYNLDIQEGEFVSIMGGSGKGKTTLLNIIGMLDVPDAGEIEICGIKDPKFDKKSGIMLLRNDISYLFQNYGLISSETVLYNLKLSLYFKNISSANEKTRISKVLESVGLANIENKKVYQLSGGEQQRVALAKIMLKSSKLILADEPTGSLDGKNRDMVLDILKTLNDEGRTIVVVTHDPEVARCSKRNINL